MENVVPFDGCSDDRPDPPRPKFSEIQFDDFASIAEADWYIHELLPKRGVVVIYGPSGSGKSFFTFELFATLARSLKWYGEETEACRCVYITAENPSSIRLRSYAYRQKHNVTREDMKNLTFIEDCPDFFNRNDAAAIAAMVGKANVIGIDTFARIIPGADENSAQDIGKAIAQCELLAKLTGALVVLVHHTGKDPANGARGSSALKCAIDTEISVEKKNNLHIATVIKQRDGKVGTKYPFSLDVYPLGENKKGKTITTCIFVQESQQNMNVSDGHPKPQGKWQEYAMSGFNQLYSPVQKFVPIEALITHVQADQITDDEKAANRVRERIKEGIQGLLQKKLLMRNNNNLFRP